MHRRRLRDERVAVSEDQTRKRAAIYARISMDRDGDAVGTARQVDECSALANELGLDVVRTFIDNDVSAYQTKKARPQFQALLAAARAGAFDVLIVWAADRLYRRLSDLESVVTALDEAKVPVQSVRSGNIDLSTADGRFQARMLGTVASHESEKKSERVKSRARQRKMVEGRQSVGQRPFGWAWADPHPDDPNRPTASRKGLVPHPVEAPILARGYEMLTEEGASLGRIARWMRDQGVTGTRGGELKQSSLGSILRQARHAGLIDEVDHQTGKRGAVLRASADGRRIVDRDLWERAQRILGDPKRKSKPGRPTKSLLSGFAVCGVCGSKIAASSNGARSGRYQSYDCASTRHVSIKRDRLDRYVTWYVGELLVSLRPALVAAASSPTGNTETRKGLLELQQRRESAAEMYATGRLSLEMFATTAEMIDSALASIEDEVTAEAETSSSLDAVINEDDIVEAWTELVATDPMAAKDVMRALGVQVTLNPRKEGVVRMETTHSFVVPDSPEEASDLLSAIGDQGKILDVTVAERFTKTMKLPKSG